LLAGSLAYSAAPAGPDVFRQTFTSLGWLPVRARRRRSALLVVEALDAHRDVPPGRLDRCDGGGGVQGRELLVVELAHWPSSRRNRIGKTSAPPNAGHPRNISMYSGARRPAGWWEPSALA